jgi:putative Mg2+ transporter-C (MgtC) family protein
MVSAAAAVAGHGQGWRQVGELLLAFVLSSAVGLERQLRGKPAGLRTQSIVGTSSALVLQVGKYGFADVLDPGLVTLDPSRVASQIVSGIGFLGAGLIITRRGAIRGLTTAAAVWETAAIGMAAGAGLPLLAGVVTALHFVMVLGYTVLGRRLPGADRGTASFRVVYEDGRGVLRELLAACTAHSWSLTALTSEGPVTADDANPLLPDDEDAAPRLVAVALGLAGPGAAAAGTTLAATRGVVGVQQVPEDDD